MGNTNLLLELEKNKLTFELKFMKERNDLIETSYLQEKSDFESRLEIIMTENNRLKLENEK